MSKISREATEPICVQPALRHELTAAHRAVDVFLYTFPNALTYGYTNRANCHDFGFGQIGRPADTILHATEHILEIQMLKNFFDQLPKKSDCYTPQLVNQDTCKCLRQFWYLIPAAQRPTISGVKKDPINHVGGVFPSQDNAWGYELVLLDKEVNNFKEGFWGISDARNLDTLAQYVGEGHAAFKYVKDTITAIRYHTGPTIRQYLIDQKNRVGDMLNDLETTDLPQTTRNIGGQPRTWASLDLQTKWNTYMRNQAAKAITGSAALVDMYLTKLQDGYTSPAQRDAATRPTADAQILAALIRKIDSLTNEWTNHRPVWTNPF